MWFVNWERMGITILILMYVLMVPAVIMGCTIKYPADTVIDGRIVTYHPAHKVACMAFHGFPKHLWRDDKGKLMQRVVVVGRSFGAFPQTSPADADARRIYATLFP